jgi:hypothetical protein
MKGRFAKASFAIATALVLLSAPVGATTSVTMDGVWWQGLSEGEKVVALQGILAGLSTGYDQAYYDGAFAAMATFKVPVTSSAAIKVPHGTPPDFTKPFGTYIDELDLWYKTYPKAATVYSSYVLVWCFADKPRLSQAECGKLGTDAKQMTR